VRVANQLSHYMQHIHRVANQLSHYMQLIHRVANQFSHYMQHIHRVANQHLEQILRSITTGLGTRLTTGRREEVSAGHRGLWGCCRTGEYVSEETGGGWLWEGACSIGYRSI